jgi:hypothetical protein
MLTLEQLNQKRTVLIAQKDQLAANLNATIGAIAAVDELIDEASRGASSQETKPGKRGNGPPRPTAPPSHRPVG